MLASGVVKWLCNMDDLAGPMNTDPLLGSALLIKMYPLSLQFPKRFILLSAYSCFACMYICMPCGCLVPLDIWRGYHMSWSWSYIYSYMLLYGCLELNLAFLWELVLLMTEPSLQFHPFLSVMHGPWESLYFPTEEVSAGASCTHCVERP